MPTLPWDWARPTGLWALGLPVLLLLLVRLRAKPLSWATGTVALWKEVGGPDPRRAARKSRRTPPRVLLAALALGVGAVALAGPRARRPELPRTWRLVLDPTPSMRLAHPGPGAGPASRRDVALERALDWLAPRLGPADRVRWTSPVRETFHGAGDERPGAAWLAPPRHFAEPPAWELFDDEGTLWITDAAPAVAPERAGLFASGGEAVPGPVAATAAGLLMWEGGALRETAARGDPPLLAIREEEATLPSLVADFAALWAAERGYEVARAERDGEAALVLIAEPGVGETWRVRTGRDRWLGVVEVGRRGLPAPLGTRPEEPWLQASGSEGEAITVVAATPGRVRVGLRGLTDLAGDPAAFAVSWSELFETFALPHPEVVPLAERVSAGDPVERGTSPPPAVRVADEGLRSRGAPLDAWLAAASGLLALVAMSLASR